MRARAARQVEMRLGGTLASLILAGCASAAHVDAERPVDLLRSPDPEVREFAVHALRDLGPGALPALRAHVDDSDSEGASWCTLLVDEVEDSRLSDREWCRRSSLLGIDLQVRGLGPNIRIAPVSPSPLLDLWADLCGHPAQCAADLAEALRECRACGRPLPCRTVSECAVSWPRLLRCLVGLSTCPDLTLFVVLRECAGLLELDVFGKVESALAKLVFVKRTETLRVSWTGALISELRAARRRGGATR